MEINNKMKHMLVVVAEEGNSVYNKVRVYNE